LKAINEALRKLRQWAWDNYAPIGRDNRYHRRWLPWLVHQLIWGIAKLYDRDPSRCWMRLAMWSMGFDGYDLHGKVEADCNYCGKCLTVKMSKEPPADAGEGER